MLTRRGFLGLLGGGALVTAVAPELLLPEPEPVRRFWQVGRNAPVRSLYDGEALVTGRPIRTPEEMSVFMSSRRYGKTEAMRRQIAMDPRARLITLKGNLTALDLEKMRNADGVIVIPSDVEIEYRHCSPRLVYGNVSGTPWLTENAALREWLGPLSNQRKHFTEDA